MGSNVPAHHPDPPASAGIGQGPTPPVQTRYAANLLQALSSAPSRYYHASMTVPDRARVRLSGISSRAYEHPADRSALVALRKLSGFDVLLSKLFGLINERALRLTYLAGAVKVSERQFPHIYALVRDGSYILDLPDVPECYIMQTPIVNAMAIGRDRPFVVITTGLVNLHDEEELRFVVGHELRAHSVGARGLPHDAAHPHWPRFPDRVDADRLHRAARDHLGP